MKNKAQMRKNQKFKISLVKPNKNELKIDQNRLENMTTTKNMLDNDTNMI